jgi:predicted transcriptional regulator
MPVRTVWVLEKIGEVAMSSHTKKGRSKKRGQYVSIPYVMARSPAWRSLKGNSVKVYIELHSRFNGGNNGDLSLSYREAQTLLSIGRSTIARAFEELEEKGFIKKTSPGHWYGRKAATYQVTDRPNDGNIATNNWMNWHKWEAQNT